MRLRIVLSAAALLSAVGTPTEAGAWYCQAISTHGATGWAVSRSMPYSRARALYERAIRTPRNHTCYIRYCR
jgi:hypothetical protein